MNSSIKTKANFTRLALQPAINYHTVLNLSSIVLIYALPIKSQTPRIKNVFPVKLNVLLQYLLMEKFVLNSVW